MAARVRHSTLLLWSLYLRTDYRLAVGFAGVVIGGVLGMFSWPAFPADAALAFASSEAQGTVTRKWKEQFQDRGRVQATFHLAYRFPGAGGGHHGQARVGQAAWAAAEEGGPVTVSYVPGEPSTNRVYREADQGNWRIFGSVLGAGLVLAGLAGTAVGARRVARTVRLVKRGVAVAGRVVRTTPKRVEKTGEQVGLLVRYEYRPPDELGGGALVAGEARAPQFGKDPWRWKGGDPLLVFVDPADPARHAVDWFRSRPDDTVRLLPSPPSG